MKPQSAKYHPCPRCRKLAIVLVSVKSDAHFSRDAMGNIQYQCINIHCHTTFSVDKSGKVSMIKPGC
jgi:hypothetical protein